MSDLFGFGTHVRAETVQVLFNEQADVEGRLYAEARTEFERGLLRAVLATTRGNVSHTAKLLGLNRATTRTMIKRCGLYARVDKRRGRKPTTTEKGQA